MGIAVRCFAVVAFSCPSTEDAKTSGPIATGAFCCLALNYFHEEGRKAQIDPVM
jgi:hypothetical protein